MQDRARDRTVAEAEKVASQMCDAGHPEACHVRSAQLARDKRRSAKALSRACDLGYGQSCFALAASTRNRGQARELRGRGFALLERHCRSENPAACFALGEAARAPARSPEQEKGKSAGRRNDRAAADDEETADPAKARWYYEKACNLGDEDACYALAHQLLADHPQLGLTLLDRACELGHGRACAEAGDQYAAGKQVEKNLQRAANAWQLACDSGAEGAYQACAVLARALLDGTLPRDPDRAAALEKRHAEIAGERRRD